MYNTVSELHIGLDLALQQLNSNRKQVLKPEEKDWFLNDTILQVINNHIDPNGVVPGRDSDSDQRVVDYLNVIKCSLKHRLPVEYNSEEGTYCINLPADYYRKSRISVDACLERRKVDNGYALVANDRLYIAEVPFPHSADKAAIANLANYIDLMTITIANRVVFNAAELVYTGGVRKYDFSNIRSADAIFMMLPTIIESCNENPWLSCYWESYGGINKKGHFIFVIDRVAYFNHYNAVMPINSTCVVATGAYSKSFAFSLKDTITVTGQPTKRIPARVVPSADLDNIQNNVFFDSSYLSVACVIEGGQIKAQGRPIFGIVNINLDYYRRPKLINYRTGQNCEIIADDFRVQLLNQTAQKINAFLDGETYNQMVKENLMML